MVLAASGLPLASPAAMPRAVQRISFYDLDRTVTAAPTWSRFLLGAARARAPWRLALVPVALGWMAAHGIGLVDRTRLKRAMQALMLGPTIDAAAAKALAETFARRVALRPGAAKRIADDRADGYRPVLATAANAFYAGAIATRLGIADVVATRSKRTPDGRLSAAIEGENCYGAAKLTMVKAWLAAQGVLRDDARVRVYTDHRSDAALLDWADEGFAVNPHPPLARLAAARGWPILDWGQA